MLLTSLLLELTDSGPTFALNFPGVVAGLALLPRAGSLPRSAPPADGVILELFSKVGWADRKQRLGGSEASPTATLRPSSSPITTLSGHRVAPPPALLEQPRHRFLLGDWVWKENLLGVLIGSAEKWDLNWENCPHAPRFAKTFSPSHFQSRNDKKGRKELKHQNHTLLRQPQKYPSQAGFEMFSSTRVSVPGPTSRP